MSVTSIWRKRLLMLGLATSVAISAWTYWQQRPRDKLEANVSATVPKNASTNGSVVGFDTVAVMDLKPVRRFSLADAETDPFAAKSWVRAPSPPPSPPPPVVRMPEAPTLPFRYVGRQEQVGSPNTTVFYMSKGQDAYAVRTGELLGGDYRFDGYANGSLQFTYLPLATVQILPIGEMP